MADRRQPAIARRDARARARGARPHGDRDDARAPPRTRTSPRDRRAAAGDCRATSSTRFLARATDMASTVERVAALDDVPAAVARYVDALDGLPAVAVAEVARRRLLARIRTLDWRGAGLAIEARPTTGTTGSASPAASARSPRPARWCSRPARTRRRRRRCCRTRTSPIVRADRIVAGMEEAFALRSRRTRRDAARRQPDLGPVAHRRHRADDRARRARSVPDAHRAGRLIRSCRQAGAGPSQAGVRGTIRAKYRASEASETLRGLVNRRIPAAPSRWRCGPTGTRRCTVGSKCLPRWLFMNSMPSSISTRACTAARIPARRTRQPPRRFARPAGCLRRAVRSDSRSRRISRDGRAR